LFNVSAYLERLEIAMLYLASGLGSSVGLSHYSMHRINAGRVTLMGHTGGDTAKRGRPKAARRLKRVTLTLLPEDWEGFEVIGADSGMATAVLIRLTMREFLDRRREGKTLAVKLGPRKED
jgi:hypothetical protein